MRQENYRNKMKVNRMTTALLGIFFYILLVLVLKTVQNLISIGSSGMKIFNIVEFAAAAVYLVIYTWINFKNAIQETGGSFGRYLLFSMIPLIVMTVLTIIVSYTGNSGTFGSNWNAVTFIIGPTLFCYIPYGIILQFANNMPMILFYIIALAFIAGFQFLGYILGSGERKFAKEREMVRAEQSRRMMQRQDEMARQATQERYNQVRRRSAVKRQTVIDENDPFRDIENTPIVETEAFTAITDDMIEEAIRLKKIKTPQEKDVDTRYAKDLSKAENNRTKEEGYGKPNIGSVRANSQVQGRTADDLSDQSVHTTKNIQKELEILRKRLEKGENSRQ